MKIGDKSLDSEIKEIQEYISQQLHNDPVSLQERLLKLSQYIGWVAELKSRAQEQLEIAIGQATKELISENYKWAILNNLVKGNVAKENSRVVQLDRIGSAISHQIDAIRSVISFAKEELKNS